VKALHRDQIKKEIEKRIAKNRKIPIFAMRQLTLERNEI
jgi:hypothetical protein